MSKTRWVQGIVVAAVASLLVGSAAGLTVNLLDGADGVRWTIHTHEVMSALNAAQAPSDDYATRRLKELTADNPAQQQLCDALAQARQTNDQPRLREVVRQMLDEERRLLVERQGRWERAAVGLAVSAAGFVCVCLGLVGYLLGQWASQRNVLADFIQGVPKP